VSETDFWLKNSATAWSLGFINLNFFIFKN
jgi:hypothetical protein